MNKCFNKWPSAEVSTPFRIVSSLLMYFWNVPGINFSTVTNSFSSIFPKKHFVLEKSSITVAHQSGNRAAKFLANEFIWTTFLDCVSVDCFNISVFYSAEVLHRFITKVASLNLWWFLEALNAKRKPPSRERAISVRNDTGPKTTQSLLSISNSSTPTLKILFSTGLMIFPNLNISTAERLFGTTEDTILFVVLTGDTTPCEITFFWNFLCCGWLWNGSNSNVSEGMDFPDSGMIKQTYMALKLRIWSNREERWLLFWILHAVSFQFGTKTLDSKFTFIKNQTMTGKIIWFFSPSLAPK